MNLHQVKIEGFFGIKASSEKIVLPTQSSGEMLRARLLDDIRKDDLLDDNNLPSTVESGMEWTVIGLQVSSNLGMRMVMKDVELNQVL